MEIENNQVEDSSVASEMPIESPMTGEDQSFADIPGGEQAPESTEQEAASQGGAKDQQRTDGVDPQEDLGPSAGMAPEGVAPEVHENELVSSNDSVDIANAVEDEKSFWGGFFGRPNIPTVGE